MASNEEKKYPVQLNLLLCPTREAQSPLSTDPQSRLSIARLALMSPSRYRSYPLAVRDQTSNPEQVEHLLRTLSCAASDAR